jgi:hypothetical protein
MLLHGGGDGEVDEDVLDNRTERSPLDEKLLEVCHQSDIQQRPAPATSY